VRTVKPGAFPDLADLREELEQAVHQAIVGTRLPLTSVEAPLPAFSFGQLYHGPAGGESPASWQQILAPWGAADARLLELLLRATPTDEVHELAAALAPQGSSLVPLLRRMFLVLSAFPFTEVFAR